MNSFDDFSIPGHRLNCLIFCFLFFVFERLFKGHKFIFCMLSWKIDTPFMNVQILQKREKEIKSSFWSGTYKATNALSKICHLTFQQDARKQYKQD